MRDRQTWDQACWRESGSRGVYTLAPLPWLTLLLSFCALMSLLPPRSLLFLTTHRPPCPHPRPHSGHAPLPTPPPPQLQPFTPSSGGGAQPKCQKRKKKRKKKLPWARGPEESLAPLVSTEKTPSSSSSSSSYARPPARPSPVQALPRPVEAHSSASHSQKGGTLKTMTHTGEVPRQLPVAPNGHQQGFKLLGLKHVLSFFFF